MNPQMGNQMYNNGNTRHSQNPNFAMNQGAHMMPNPVPNNVTLQSNAPSQNSFSMNQNNNSMQANMGYNNPYQQNYGQIPQNNRFHRMDRDMYNQNQNQMIFNPGYTPQAHRQPYPNPPMQQNYNNQSPQNQHPISLNAPKYNVYNGPNNTSQTAPDPYPTGNTHLKVSKQISETDSKTTSGPAPGTHAQMNYRQEPNYQVDNQHPSHANRHRHNNQDNRNGPTSYSKRTEGFKGNSPEYTPRDVFGREDRRDNRREERRYEVRNRRRDERNSERDYERRDNARDERTRSRSRKKRGMLSGMVDRSFNRNTRLTKTRENYRKKRDESNGRRFRGE